MSAEASVSNCISNLFKPTAVGEFDVAEVHDHLLIREGDLPVYHGRSPQPELRPLIIDWISATCNTFGLHATCEHLSVALLDYFMDDYVVDGQQLELLALCCIQIAAKVEERELCVPRPAELGEHTSVTYSNGLCMKMELEILNHAKWKLGIPTVAHFCCYYASLLVDSTDKLLGVALSSNDVDTVQELCGEYFFYLINVPLQDITYRRRYRSSVTACAVIAVVRKLVGLEPLWPSRLEQVSGNNENKFVHAYARILVDYEKAKAKLELAKKESPQDRDDESSLSSGYRSQGSPADSTATGAGSADLRMNNSDISDTETADSVLPDETASLSPEQQHPTT